MEELVLPGEETETAVDVELGVEILIWVCRGDADETGLVVDGEPFS